MTTHEKLVRLLTAKVEELKKENISPEEKVRRYQEYVAYLIVTPQLP